MGSISTKRIANYKLGRVTDKSLLKKLKAADYSGFEELLMFAKNDSTNLKSGELKVNDISNEQPALYEQTDLVEGEYYYVYLELDSEEGKYYELDDVNLYQCLNNNGTLWLTDIYDQRFKWLEEDELWDKFVEKYKSTELIKSYEDSEATVEITSTENSLKVVLTNETKSWTTNFTYEDGILTYVPSNNEESMMKEGIFVSNAIYALADLYEYDIEQLKAWLKENDPKDFTLEKDGVEVKLIKIEQESNGSSISVETPSSFKLDLKSGLKSFEKYLNEENKEEKEEIKTENKKEENTSKDKVENPKTGMNLGFGILILVILMGGIGYFLIRKQSKFPKHN